MIGNWKSIKIWILAVATLSSCGSEINNPINKRHQESSMHQNLEKVLTVYGLDAMKKNQVLNLTKQLELSIKENDETKMSQIKEKLERYNRDMNVDQQLDLVSSGMANDPLSAFVEFLISLLGLDRQPTPQPTPQPNPEPLPIPEKDICKLDAPISSNGFGPYEPAKLSISRNVTVHYPQNLSESDCLHGVIAWGNGTGRMGGSNYMPTFRKWVSYGFVVAVHHSATSGSGGPHKAALDTLFNVAQSQDSIFHNKLNPNAAISGQSQGGLGTSAGSGDRRFVTAVPIAGASRGAAKPSLFLTSQSDFMRSSAVSAYNGHRGSGTLLVAKGTGHVSVPFHKGLLNVSVAWYRCFLNQNEDACRAVKDDCSVCQEQSDLADIRYKNW